MNKKTCSIEAPLLHITQYTIRGFAFSSKEKFRTKCEPSSSPRVNPIKIETSLH